MVVSLAVAAFLGGDALYIPLCNCKYMGPSPKTEAQSKETVAVERQGAS